MPFEAGKAANPTGFNGRKLFVDALHCIISLESATGIVPPLPAKATIAHHLANKLVKEALGNPKDPKTALAFIQEICDRAYGRPKQAITGGDDDDPAIKLTLTAILRGIDGRTASLPGTDEEAG